MRGQECLNIKVMTFQPFLQNRADENNSVLELTKSHLTVLMTLQTSNELNDVVSTGS